MNPCRRLGASLLLVVSLHTADAATPPADQLLVQHIDLNEPNVQAKGKVALRSLKPLAWELTMERYDGDPKPLIRTLGLISPGAAKALGEANLAWVRMSGLDCRFDQGSLSAQLPRLELPDGGVRQVQAQWHAGGRWSLAARQGSLANLPLALLKPLQPLAFADIQAQGTALDGHGTLTGVTLPGIRAKQARFQAQLADKGKTRDAPRPTRVNLSLEEVKLSRGGQGSWLPELLDNLGLQPAAQPFPLAVTFAAFEEPGRLRLEEFHLEAPMVQTMGRAELLPKENPPVLLVDLNAHPKEGKPRRVVRRIPLQGAGS